MPGEPPAGGVYQVLAADGQTEAAAWVPGQDPPSYWWTWHGHVAPQAWRAIGERLLRA